MELVIMIVGLAVSVGCPAAAVPGPPRFLVAVGAGARSNLRLALVVEVQAVEGHVGWQARRT
jgi:hypothetical protein